MCLSTAKINLLDGEGIGYKFIQAGQMDIDDENYLLPINGHFGKDCWSRSYRRADDQYLYMENVKDVQESKYNSGYHILLTKEDAVKYAGYNFGYIVEVSYREITAIGKQKKYSYKGILSYIWGCLIGRFGHLDCVIAQLMKVNRIVGIVDNVKDKNIGIPFRYSARHVDIFESVKGWINEYGEFNINYPFKNFRGK